jgi:argininosuccinate lyase
VTWAHWLLSHFWPLTRDANRLKASRDSAATLPLGSAALAGTAYNVDREKLAQELGFARVSENSLDAVSDRDFAADFLFAMALLGVHLSRLAEQLILFNSREFSFITLSDAYSTGSSLMPQKKNPDTLELARGKSGRLTANLMSLLVTLKGLPSGYDKDLQEDKEPVFSSFDTLRLTLPVLAGTINTLELQPERMRAQLESGLLATDLADYLVQKGLPFRQAHELVGRVIRVAEERDDDLDQLPMAVLSEISPHFDSDVRDWLDFERSVAARRVRGGTAPEALKEQLAAAHHFLSTY